MSERSVNNRHRVVRVAWLYAYRPIVFSVVQYFKLCYLCCVHSWERWPEVFIDFIEALFLELVLNVSFVRGFIFFKCGLHSGVSKAVNLEAVSCMSQYWTCPCVCYNFVENWIESAWSKKIAFGSYRCPGRRRLKEWLAHPPSDSYSLAFLSFIIPLIEEMSFKFCKLTFCPCKHRWGLVNSTSKLTLIYGGRQGQTHCNLISGSWNADRYFAGPLGPKTVEFPFETGGY